LGFVALVSIGFVAACAKPEPPWKTYEEVVVAGDRERIASHGSWSRNDGKCKPKEPPRLEIEDRPAHGTVEFKQKKRRPSECKQKFDHAVVYYRADKGFSGKDRFSYHRIDTEGGEKRLIVVELRVKPSKGS
jgi:hypothetical protein